VVLVAAWSLLGMAGCTAVNSSSAVYEPTSYTREAMPVVMKAAEYQIETDVTLGETSLVVDVAEKYDCMKNCTERNETKIVTEQRVPGGRGYLEVLSYVFAGTFIGLGIATADKNPDAAGVGMGIGLGFGIPLAVWPTINIAMSGKKTYEEEVWRIDESIPCTYSGCTSRALDSLPVALTPVPTDGGFQDVRDPCESGLPCSVSQKGRAGFDWSELPPSILAHEVLELRVDFDDGWTTVQTLSLASDPHHAEARTMLGLIREQSFAALDQGDASVCGVLLDDHYPTLDDPQKARVQEACGDSAALIDWQVTRAAHVRELVRFSLSYPTRLGELDEASLIRINAARSLESALEDLDARARGEIAEIDRLIEEAREHLMEAAGSYVDGSLISAQSDHIEGNEAATKAIYLTERLIEGMGEDVVSIGDRMALAAVAAVEAPDARLEETLKARVGDESSWFTVRWFNGLLARAREGGVRPYSESPCPSRDEMVEVLGSPAFDPEEF